MTKEKTMKDIQREVDEYIGQFKEGYFSPLAMMARLTEELGELAREINHHYGEKPKKKRKRKKDRRGTRRRVICFSLFSQFTSYIIR